MISAGRCKTDQQGRVGLRVKEPCEFPPNVGLHLLAVAAHLPAIDARRQGTEG